MRWGTKAGCRGASLGGEKGDPLQHAGRAGTPQRRAGRGQVRARWQLAGQGRKVADTQCPVVKGRVAGRQVNDVTAGQGTPRHARLQPGRRCCVHSRGRNINQEPPLVLLSLQEQGTFQTGHLSLQSSPGLLALISLKHSGGAVGAGRGRLALGTPAGLPLAVSGPQLTGEVAGGDVPLLGTNL